MAKYRKKPVVINAFQLGIDDPPTWFEYAKEVRVLEDGCCVIHTLEGDHLACPGDFIIQGMRGELYPCKPANFAATYEAVPLDDLFPPPKEPSVTSP